MDRDKFESYIPSSKVIPEFTLKAVLVGTLLAVILGAANAYLGLYAGMTVSAVIPGAVMAFALLRPFKGTILEVNLGMMGAAAGEALAAGVIFTIPALVILGTWSEIHYIETTLVAFLGGVLGVLWMVPLRRALVIKTDLPFPEGVAVAAVLTSTVKSGEEKHKKSAVSGIWLAFGAIAAGILKFLQEGLNLIETKIEGLVNIGKYNIGGGENNAYLYGGLATSPALLSVGWIIGPKIAVFILVGGLLGWVIITPLILLAVGYPAGLSPLDGFYYIWSTYVRYIGVGAMVVGGLYTIFKLRENLAAGIKEAVTGIRGGEVKTKERVDQDLSFKKVFLTIAILAIPVIIVYGYISNLWEVSIFMGIFAILFAFIASAIAGYMAGLIGSSNNPISGVTVSVLLITSLILLVFGVKGTGAFGVAILIAAVICCAAALSGDVLQSMACGRIIGATPRHQQIMEMIGALAAAPVLAIVVQVLDQAYKIGSDKLPAPQAFLMAGIVKGVLGGEMVWPFVIAGMVLAIILILLDLPVLPVAIGIYLPFTLATPIFGGGIIRAITDRHLKKKYGSAEEEEISDWELAIKETGIKPKEKVIRTGLLLSAGMIAGEALTGVIVAFLFVAGMRFAVFPAGEAPLIPALLLFALIAILLAYIPLRDTFGEKK